MHSDAAAALSLSPPSVPGHASRRAAAGLIATPDIPMRLNEVAGLTNYDLAMEAGMVTGMVILVNSADATGKASALTFSVPGSLGMEGVATAVRTSSDTDGKLSTADSILRADGRRATPHPLGLCRTTTAWRPWRPSGHGRGRNGCAPRPCGPAARIELAFPGEPSPSSQPRRGLVASDPMRCRGALALADWCLGILLGLARGDALLRSRSCHGPPMPRPCGGWRTPKRWSLAAGP